MNMPSSSSGHFVGFRLMLEVEVMCGRQCVSCTGQFDGIWPVIAVRA
jgi:hypothetical protein